LLANLGSTETEVSEQPYCFGLISKSVVLKLALSTIRVNAGEAAWVYKSDGRGGGWYGA
jgi:hypothetical protein